MSSPENEWHPSPFEGLVQREDDGVTWYKGAASSIADCVAVTPQPDGTVGIADTVTGVGFQVELASFEAFIDQETIAGLRRLLGLD